MFKKNEVCEILGIEKPIIQAPMGPFLTTNLCAAVSDTGCLGCVSHTGSFTYMREKFPEDFNEIKESAPKLVNDALEMEERMGKDVWTLQQIQDVKELTDNPFAVNVRVTQIQVDAPYLIDAIIEERENDPELAEQLKVVVTSAGNPELYTEKLQDAGLKVVHVVPTAYHAQKAESAGVDAVVASGHQAGGHISWSPVHTNVLLPAISDAVDIPVISAGGWSDGRGLVAALTLGADAIYMGTRFIATQESDFHENYKEAVVEGEARETVATAGMLGPIRILENEYTEKLQEALDSVAGPFKEKAQNFDEYPEVYEAKTRASQADPYVEGEVDDAPVLLGEAMGRINDIPTVEELVDRILEDAEEIIRKRLPSYLE